MRLMPMYWVRVVGGTLYITGMVMFGYNILMTWQARPGDVRGAGDPGAAARRRRTRSPRTAPAPAGALGALRPGARWHRALGSGCRSPSRC